MSRLSSATVHLKKLRTPEEVSFVRDNYRLLNNQQIANILGRSITFVKDIIQSEQLTGKTWRPGEEQFIRDNYHSMTQVQLAKALNRGPAFINKRARQLGLSKPRHHQALKAKPSDLEFIRLNYHTLSNKMIAAFLRRSESFVEKQIRSLQLVGKVRANISEWTRLDPELKEIITLSRKLKKAINERSLEVEKGTVR